MQNVDEHVTLTQKIYEFIKTRGCATIDEIARAVGITTRHAYIAMRTLFARRLVLPYRPGVGRERMYCIPAVGDKRYGQYMRSNSSGVICITLPIDLIETIDEVAVSMRKTRSSIIKQALIQYIHTHYLNERPEDEQQELQEDEKLDLIAPDR
jgi:predicted transcriptional regulator